VSAAINQTETYLMKRDKLMVNCFCLSFLMCCQQLLQGQENDKFPISAELVETILTEVGKDEVSGAISNVTDILKNRFHISAPETWSYWIRVKRQNSHFTIVNKQRIFDNGNNPLIVYKVIADKIADFRKADLIVTDGREDIKISSESLRSSNGMGREQTGTIHHYAAWLIQEGIILACGDWERDGTVRVWKIDSTGTKQWSSNIEIGGIEPIGNVLIRFGDGEDAVAFFLSGDKEQAVYVFDKQSGETKFWWSTRLYQSSKQD